MMGETIEISVGLLGVLVPLAVMFGAWMTFMAVNINVLKRDVAYLKNDVQERLVSVQKAESEMWRSMKEHDKRISDNDKAIALLNRSGGVTR